jgi:hypothetical protein
MGGDQWTAMGVPGRGGRRQGPLPKRMWVGGHRDPVWDREREREERGPGPNVNAVTFGSQDGPSKTKGSKPSPAH